MKSLTPEIVATVRAGLKGKRLEKFNTSVQIINDSLALGGWLTGMSRKAPVGTGSGCGLRWDPTLDYNDGGQHNKDFRLLMCVNYGSYPAGEVNEAAIDRLFRAATWKNGKEVLVTKGFTREFVKAWLAICDEVHEAIAYLDSLRPLPVITKIGLSPKVTATLKEMSLDINLPSIKMAEIKYREVPAINRDGSPRYKPDGTRDTMRVPYVAWTPGTKFGRSRFHDGCQACGKRIPSNMYVPIEADDLKSGDHCGFWIGCDCARNIFGVKDIGVEKPDMSKMVDASGSVQ